MCTIYPMIWQTPYFEFTLENTLKQLDRSYNSMKDFIVGLHSSISKQLYIVDTGLDDAINNLDKEYELKRQYWKKYFEDPEFKKYCDEQNRLAEIERYIKDHDKRKNKKYKHSRPKNKRVHISKSFPNKYGKSKTPH